MRNVLKLLIAFIALALGALDVYAQKTTVSYEVSYQEASAKLLEPMSSVMSIPVVCDVKVMGGLIEHVETEAFKDYVVTEDLLSNMLNFKQIALCKAAQKYNADIIIGASLFVNTNEAGNLEITVSGYPAKYENFRNATMEELQLISVAKGTFVDHSREVLGTPTSQLKVEDTQTKKAGLAGFLN